MTEALIERIVTRITDNPWFAVSFVLLGIFAVLLAGLIWAARSLVPRVFRYLQRRDHTMRLALRAAAQGRGSLPDIEAALELDAEGEEATKETQRALKRTGIGTGIGCIVFIVFCEAMSAMAGVRLALAAPMIAGNCDENVKCGRGCSCVKHDCLCGTETDEKKQPKKPKKPKPPKAPTSEVIVQREVIAGEFRPWWETVGAGR